MSADAPRSSTSVHQTLNRRLEHYVLAATTAGVGFAALTQPAEAQVVYTPAHVTLTDGHVCTLDLNGDGTKDFALVDSIYDSSSGHRFTLTVKGLTSGNEVMAFATDRGIWNDADALRQGARIAPTTGFQSAMLARFSTSFAGEHFLSGRWVNIQNHYLGVKFQITGQNHFGWVRLSVHVNQDALNAYITGYAYESLPDTPINAGQTTGSNESQAGAGLGHLALGALGLRTTQR